jgi:phosphatidylinositol glycan class M
MKTYTFVTILTINRFGQEFLDNAYLYHIGRRDHRHNFSVYYYSIYLSFDQQVNRALGLVTFLPQMIVVTLSGILYGKDLVFAAFLQTFAFVMFNKVITSQVSVTFSYCNNHAFSISCGTCVLYHCYCHG